eukprot:g22572.t1
MGGPKTYHLTVSQYCQPLVLGLGMKDAQLSFWDATSGTALHAGFVRASSPARVPGSDVMTRAVTGLALSRRRPELCLSCGLDGSVLLWSLKQLVQPWPNPSQGPFPLRQAVLEDGGTRRLSCALSDSGRLAVASGDGSTSVFDCETQCNVRSLPGSGVVFPNRCRLVGPREDDLFQVQGADVVWTLFDGVRLVAGRRACDRWWMGSRSAQSSRLRESAHLFAEGRGILWVAFDDTVAGNAAANAGDEKGSSTALPVERRDLRTCSRLPALSAASGCPDLSQTWRSSPHVLEARWDQDVLLVGAAGGALVLDTRNSWQAQPRFGFAIPVQKRQQYEIQLGAI